MSAGYLIDTDVLSEPLRLRPSTRVVERLRRHDEALATAAPVWHELWFGVLRMPESPKRTRVQQYLQRVVLPGFDILPYDEAAAAWHAQERARLSRSGRTPPFVDGQIAAIARTRDLILVTGNVRDFSGFEGLHVENWRE